MKIWMERGRVAAMMLLALVVASCDHAGMDATGPAGEFDPQMSSSVQTVEGSDGRTYTLVEEPNLASEEKRVSLTIDHNGGSLEIHGHRLTVPAGAVTLPTVFTMLRLPNGVVMVHLFAVQTTLLGGTLNIGALGFEKPVTVSLTYSRGTNLPADLQSLVILRLNPKGTGYPHEVLPVRVDEETQTVQAKLDHFSGYAMAM